MIYSIIHYVLNFMGWLASFFVELTPNNRLFIELGTFLFCLFLLCAAGLIIACRLAQKGQ